MKPKKKNNLAKTKNALVDIEKLKEFGITRDPNNNDIQEVDGENITGGKNKTDSPSVETHWPTTSN